MPACFILDIYIFLGEFIEVHYACACVRMCVRERERERKRERKRDPLLFTKNLTLSLPYPVLLPYS